MICARYLYNCIREAFINECILTNKYRMKDNGMNIGYYLYEYEYT